MDSFIVDMVLAKSVLGGLMKMRKIYQSNLNNFQITFPTMIHTYVRICYN